MSTQTNQHISWVDFSKGICIIGVVVMYAGKKLEDVGWVGLVIDFMQPFRMPDFFLLSGLFLGNSMRRSLRTYIDKRVVHYLYFFFLWTVIFYLFRVVSLQLGLFTSPSEGEDSLWYRLREPYAMLWFIQLLPFLCLVTRACSAIPSLLMVLLGVLLQTFPLHLEGLGLLSHFCGRFIYFYCGYRFAPYFFALAAKAQKNVYLSLSVLLLWAYINFVAVQFEMHELPVISLILGMAGGMATVVAGSLLSQVSFGWGWLRYLGEKSLVIYLGFYLPMMCLIPIVGKFQVHIPFMSTLGAGVIAVFIGSASVISALLLYWCTKKGVFSFLFVRPSWAMLKP